MDENVSIEELAEEMDELGRTKLALAMSRVENKRLRARVAELENAAALAADPAAPDAGPLPGEKAR